MRALANLPRYVYLSWQHRTADRVDRQCDLTAAGGDPCPPPAARPGATFATEGSGWRVAELCADALNRVQPDPPHGDGAGAGAVWGGADAVVLNAGMRRFLGLWRYPKHNGR